MTGPGKKLSTSEPVGELRSIPIVECGEPLVDFLELCPKLIWDKPRFAYRRETLARKGVAEMLCKASELLPKGLRLAIVEGWRPPHIQKRMLIFAERRLQELHPDWGPVQLKRMRNRFTAPIDSRVPPPHSTGGAVDLRLVRDDGAPLDHYSPYPNRDTRSYAFDAPGLSDEARRTRSILKEALEGSGMTNYPAEYWHWTYGDQGWAYRGRHAHAIYGAIVPDGWEPAAADVSDDPLVWVYEDKESA